MDGAAPGDYLRGLFPLESPRAMTAPAESATDLAVARRVLAIEAAALGALGAALNGAFAAAVETLLGVSGRVIVSEPPATPAADDTHNPQPQPAMTPNDVNQAVEQHVNRMQRVWAH